MLNRLLQYNYSTVGIFLFLVLVKTIMVLTGQVDSGHYQDSLFHILENPTYWGGVLAALMTLLLGLLIFINSERNAKRTDFSYWIVLIFAIQMCFHSFFSITVEYFALLFFIVGLYFFSVSLHDHDSKNSTVNQFNLSFCLALGTLFVPHLIYTLPIFWLCGVFATNISFKGLFASLIGIAAPFIIIDTLIFCFYAEIAQYTHLFVIEKLMQAPHNVEQAPIAGIILTYTGPIAMIIASLYITLRGSKSLKIVIRKFNIVNFVFLITLTLLVVIELIPAHFGTMLLLVPGSYFYSNFQVSATKLWRNIFLLVIMLSAFISYPPVYTEIIETYNSLLNF